MRPRPLLPSSKKTTMSTQSFAPNPFKPFNPFIAAEPTIDVVADAMDQTGRECYALVQSGPAVAADEVESHLDAVEVTVRWGAETMKVSHVKAGASFVLGEGGDFVMPEALLGGANASLVVSRGNAGYAIVPRNARGTFTAKGENAVALEGGTEVLLVANAKVAIEMGDFTIDIAAVRAGKVLPVGFLGRLGAGAMGMIGLSALGHAAIVASLAFFMPKMATNDAENVDRDQMLLMQKFLAASAEKEVPPPPPERQTASDPTGGGSTGADPHKGPEGSSGVVTSKNDGRAATKRKGEDPQLTRKDELALARDFGMIGLMATGPQPGVASPWATDDPAGRDAENKHGKMYGQTIDDAFGFGFGLHSAGESGGGDGTGIALKGIGTKFGGGGGPGEAGIGKGDKDDLGNGHGKLPGTHGSVAPNIRQPPTFDTNGRIPADVIQRIVRMNFGRFMMCYQDGLKNNPSLTGRVSTRFIINRDGSVMSANDAGSDMPDQKVTACIVSAFHSLSFPEPQGGVATVTYPLVLTPAQ